MQPVHTHDRLHSLEVSPNDRHNPVGDVSMPACVDSGRGDEALQLGVPATRKIRVLMVITRLTVGGDTNVVLDLAEHFRAHASIEVHLAFGLVPSHEIDLTRLAIERRIPTIVVPGLSNRPDPRRMAAAVWQLYRLLRCGDYDVVHTHSSAAGIVGRTAAALAGVPVIVHHVHGWGLQEGMSPVRRAVYLGLERACARYTTRLIAVSRPTIEKGLAHGIGPAEKYALVYNGLDLQKFRRVVDRRAVCLKLGLNPDCQIVGMVGRLDRQKNPLDLIQAAALVCREQPNVQFAIMGDGVLRSRCEALIDRLGLHGRCLLLGFRDDVEVFLPITALVVSSALWEGLPIVFQEAMSAAKPIVATDVDGTRDVVVEGETGLLVPPHDPEVLAARILILLRDQRLREEMGQRARAQSNRFSVEQMIGHVEMLYTTLAGAAPVLSQLSTESRTH